MPRDRRAVARERVLRAKAQVARLEATLEVARKDARKLIVAAYQAGLTQTELAEIWGTSQSRMRENIVRGKAELEGII